MGLETGTYIDDLVTSNPAGTDVKSQGDDHLRLIKTVVKNTFPNASKAFRFPTTTAKATVDSPYTQLVTELNTRYVIDAAAGAFTINLLAAATAGSGFIFQIVRKDTTTNTITLDPSGAETINGNSTLSINQGAIVFCDGSTWYAFPNGPDLTALTTETTIDANTDFLPFFDTSVGRWRKALVNKFTTPVGMIGDFAGTTAPAGWVLAYGQPLDTTTYAALFAVIGYTYGGAGASFNLPDMRGRVTGGKDDMGGVSANRLTGLSGGVNGDILGATGGVEAHTLTGAESGVNSHSHGHSLGTTTTGAHQHSIALDVNEGSEPMPQSSDGGGLAPSGLTGSTGDHAHSITGSISSATPASASSAHNNVQPIIIINKMIYAGV